MVLPLERGKMNNFTETTKRLLSPSEITFIKGLAEENFKSNELCNSFETKERLLLLYKKLKVTSFEEILRKLLFHNLIDLKLSDDYMYHIEKISREKISTQIIIRNTMLDFAKNASSIFCDFCFNSHYLTSPEREKRTMEYISKIKSDKETNTNFAYTQSFIRLISFKHDFEQIFYTIFNLEDAEYCAVAQTVFDIFGSIAVKYLFIVRVLIDLAFPVCKNRQLEYDEKKILRYLLYKGDEIDYMQQFEIPPVIFYEKINNIIVAYNAKDIQEMLIKANLDISFNTSSLIYSFIFLKIKTIWIRNKWDDVVKVTPLDKHKRLVEIQEKIDFYIQRELFSAEFTKNFCEQIKNFHDCDFSINGKVDPVATWFGIENLQDLYTLQTTLKELEDIVPIKKII